jgi:histidyl-tRNA synthetase
MRDYLPEDMIPRQRMLDRIRIVFESFGFAPLDTPGLELEEIITGGDPNFRMQIFRAGLRGGDEEKLALRFDLTIPLARVVAQYGSQLERPFKRYQMGKVWRGEKPQAGRFREFVQLDADTIGSSMMTADAEIIALMYETMCALGFSNFLMRVNNRKILNGLSEFVGFDSKIIPDVLRIIDKLDKDGWDAISEELVKDQAFSPEQLSLLKQFLDFRAISQRATIDGVRKLMANSQMAQEGIGELEEIVSSLEAMGIPDDKWTIDLSVARGLGYYTGPVYETVLTDAPEIGSVFGGGRYDNLVARFSSTSVPAVGVSAGVDRMFAAMTKLGMIKKEQTVAKVMVLNFDSTCRSECEKVASLVRRSGISTEIYLGKETTIKGQLSVAVRKDYPIVVIIGTREKEKGVAQIKQLQSRKQEDVLLEDVPDAIKKMLE